MPAPPLSMDHKLSDRQKAVCEGWGTSYPALGMDIRQKILSICTQISLTPGQSMDSTIEQAAAEKLQLELSKA